MTTINNSNINAILASKPQEGTVAHSEWLADISRMEREAWTKGQASMFSGSAGNMSVYQSHTFKTDAPTVPSDREFRGAMSHGEGITLPDGLIQIGDFRTDVKTAEAFRQSVGAEEWESLTGLPYQSLMQRMQIEERGSERPRTSPEEVKVEALVEPDMTDPETLETQLIDNSVLEKAVAEHWDQDVTDRIKRELIETPELTDEMVSKLGITAQMFEETVEHYREQADRVLLPVNSSAEMLSEFLSGKEQANARKALLNRDTATLRRYGEVATQRLAQMRVDELAAWMTPDEKKKFHLQDGGSGVPVVTLPELGKVLWSTAVSQGFVKL
jgi:hypothetical protein